jgi:hypothetical protein
MNTPVTGVLLESGLIHRNGLLGLLHRQNPLERRREGRDVKLREGGWEEEGRSKDSLGRSCRRRPA